MMYRVSELILALEIAALCLCFVVAAGIALLIHWRKQDV
jgi:hypothetical protein